MWAPPMPEFGSTRIGESERYDVVGDGLRVLDDQVGLVLPDDGLCGRHCHNRTPCRRSQHLFGYER